jgi:hypothetical protein
VCGAQASARTANIKDLSETNSIRVSLVGISSCHRRITPPDDHGKVLGRHRPRFQMIHSAAQKACNREFQTIHLSLISSVAARAETAAIGSRPDGR